MSNCLDPDQDQHSVGPDLFRFLADNKVDTSKESVKNEYSMTMFASGDG